MKTYSLGFAFSLDASKLVVIEKNRPDWQAGLWNGVGGKLEEGETPLQCLVREFFEETGVKISEKAWRPLTVFRNETFEVHAYAVFSDQIFQVETMTDEQIMVIDVDLNEIRRKGISNLPWLIGLALDKDQERIEISVNYN